MLGPATHSSGHSGCSCLPVPSPLQDIGASFLLWLRAWHVFFFRCSQRLRPGPLLSSIGFWPSDSPRVPFLYSVQLGNRRRLQSAWSPCAQVLALHPRGLPSRRVQLLALGSTLEWQTEAGDTAEKQKGQIWMNSQCL